MASSLSRNCIAKSFIQRLWSNPATSLRWSHIGSCRGRSQEISNGLLKQYMCHRHIINNARLHSFMFPLSTVRMLHANSHWWTAMLCRAETAVRLYSNESKPADKARGIQTGILPLTTRRIVRKKKLRDSFARDHELFDVVAYATAEAFNLETLMDDIKQQGLYSIQSLPSDVDDTLYVEANYRLDDEPRDIVFFREGTLVFWNMPKDEQDAVLKFVRQHQEQSYDRKLVFQEVELLEFAYSDGETKLLGDEIQLSRAVQKSGPVRQLEKYAFSNALALSVKLSIWEASLEHFIESIEWMLQDLKLGNKIKISRAQALRKTGELFNLRHMVNLSSDLLDTPDFYWDREDVEPLYTRTCNHLAITRRTKVMNEKLTHCAELMALLREHLNDKHHIQLEWMIIVLIMIEVGFEILHLLQNAIISDS